MFFFFLINFFSLFFKESYSFLYKLKIFSILGLIRIFSEIKLKKLEGRHEKLGSVGLVETNNLFLRLIGLISLEQKYNISA